MRYIVIALWALSVGVGGAAVAGCGDPCEKAVDKMIECVGAKSDELKKKMSKHKAQQIEACKKSDARKQAAKECIAESGCAKFMECISKAD